ncbi:MAG TPA: hypothetical protein VLI55_18365 [Bryobacteraceae bacterium]|nr:hypothetical protein [Bryobacteraceae bacterium]
MSTEAQIAANQKNSRHSTGPKSAEGKGTVSMNACRHGLSGGFLFLPGEMPADFEKLQDGLRTEHNPETPTETLLVESMAQHYWLQQRAIRLQGRCFNEAGACDAERELALYLRYQTTHERAFHKSLNTLLKLRAEKRKAEIGFVSQQEKQNRARQQAEAHARKQELHKWNVLLAQAKVDNQELQNMNLETPENRISGRIERIIAAEKAA